MRDRCAAAHRGGVRRPARDDRVPARTFAELRKVWPTVDGFTFRDDIRALISPDRLFAVGLAVFDSTGYHEDGSTFARVGRATVSFIRKSIDEPWVSHHSHMSLVRGTPAVSHGNRPAKS